MEWRSVRKNLPPQKPDSERFAEEGKIQDNLSEKKLSEADPEAE